MNGPRPVCAGCSKETTWQKPVCDECRRAMGETPLEYCALCESAVMLANSPIVKADKSGVHYTKTGGYAGRCTARQQSGDANG